MEGTGATVGWVDTWWGARETNCGAAVGCSCGDALGLATVGFRVRPRLLGGSADGGVGSIVGGAVVVAIVGDVVAGCI